MLMEGLQPADIIMHVRNSSLAVAGIGKLEAEDVFMLDEFAKNGKLVGGIQLLAEGFDYLLIDAPAGVGGLVGSLLAASDSVIPVVLCKALAIKSLPMLLNLVNWVRDHTNPDLILEGVLMTMLDERNEVETALSQELQASLPADIFFRTKIPYLEVFEKASIRSVPVGMLNEGQAAAHIYMGLVWEIKERESRSQKTGGSDELVAGLF
jgi:chromosome partitioning protein